MSETIKPGDDQAPKREIEALLEDTDISVQMAALIKDLSENQTAASSDSQ